MRYPVLQVKESSLNNTDERIILPLLSKTDESTLDVDRRGGDATTYHDMGVATSMQERTMSKILCRFIFLLHFLSIPVFLRFPLLFFLFFSLVLNATAFYTVKAESRKQIFKTTVVALTLQPSCDTAHAR